MAVVAMSAVVRAAQEKTRRDRADQLRAMLEEGDRPATSHEWGLLRDARLALEKEKKHASDTRRELREKTAELERVQTKLQELTAEAMAMLQAHNDEKMKLNAAWASDTRALQELRSEDDRRHVQECREYQAREADLRQLFDQLVEDQRRQIEALHSSLSSKDDRLAGISALLAMKEEESRQLEAHCKVELTSKAPNATRRRFALVASAGPGSLVPLKLDADAHRILLFNLGFTIYDSASRPTE